MYQRDEHVMMRAGGGAARLRAPLFDRIPAPSPRRFTLAVDLGDAIGSPRWFRGLATLGAMTAALVHMAPGIAPLPTSLPTTLSPVAENEYRAIGIAPAAYGADSGRRIAPTDLAAPLSSTPERPRIDLVATLRGGDGLAGMLAREGATAADAATVAALIAAEAPALAPGTRVTLTLGRRRDRTSLARPIDFVSLRARLDLVLAVRRVGERLVLDRQPIAVDDTPARLTGSVGASLYHAARSAGVPLTVLADYLRAIAKRVSIDEIAAADRFDMVFEHRRAATGEIETGRLLYAGLTHDGDALRLLRWTSDGREQWFDAAGVGERKEGMAMPVAGRLTSGFGMRFHPILGYSRMHQGVDLAAPYGTPIVAASDGRVSFAGWHGGHGNYVQILHGGAMMTGYGHMSRYVVAPGESVRQGQLIGYVGSTGLSTGPHCHFEVFRNGVAIDPAGANFATTTRIAAADLGAFRATLARLTALPTGAATVVAAQP